MKKVYCILFQKSSFELDKDYVRFSEQDKISISTMSPDSFFDFNDKSEKYRIYIILLPTELNKYISILKENLIEHTFEDISEGILNDTIPIDSDAKPYVTPINRFRWNSFVKIIDKWIYDRLDIDFVLDRINICDGIDNLRSVEKRFLRNYQN